MRPKGPASTRRLRRGGFTLIEVLVTLALLTAIAGLGMIGTLRPLRSASISEERDLIVSLLARARSRAMANDSNLPHGFCYDSADKSYEVFKSDYSDANKEERGLASASVQVAGIPDCGLGSEIVFTQLSGTTSPAHIDLSSGDTSTSVDINPAGTILW